MELDVTCQHGVLRAIDGDVQKPAKNAGLVNEFGDFSGLHGDAQRVLLVAINDGRDFACAACRTGGPLTDPFALISADGCNVRHCLLLDV